MELALDLVADHLVDRLHLLGIVVLATIFLLGIVETCIQLASGLLI